MTRDEIVEAIIEDITSWDTDRLLEYAQDCMLNDLALLQDIDLGIYYIKLFGDKPR